MLRESNVMTDGKLEAVLIWDDELASPKDALAELTYGVLPEAASFSEVVEFMAEVQKRVADLVEEDLVNQAEKDPSAATERLENYCLHLCKDRSPGCPHEPNPECADYMLRIKADTRFKVWACILLILATAVLIVWLWWTGLPQRMAEGPNQKCVRWSDFSSSGDTVHSVR